MGVAVDSTFNVYIADTGDNTIRKVSADGNIATIAGDSFPVTRAMPAWPSQRNCTARDVAVDSSGNVYIADTGNAYVRKVTSDGNINFIAGDGSIGYTGDGGFATSAGLIAPFALALDSSAMSTSPRMATADPQDRCQEPQHQHRSRNGTPGSPATARTPPKPK